MNRSPLTIEVRGERIGTAAWGDDEGVWAAEAVRVTSTYKAVPQAKF